jgi:ornithine cyclodeaminase/alanine dehydrogenase-like protein (mu-crystallin family)
MSIPVLTADEIERLLPMGDCIAVMEGAFTDLQRGSLHHPLRTFWAPPGVNGGTMWMAAYRSSPKPMFGSKLLSAVTAIRTAAVSALATRLLARADASAFCDRRESLQAEAGDYLQAVANGFIQGIDSVGELGELGAGVRKGRTAHDQITLFRSLGLAIEDLAAAEFVAARAGGLMPQA